MKEYSAFAQYLFWFVQGCFWLKGYLVNIIVLYTSWMTYFDACLCAEIQVAIVLICCRYWLYHNICLKGFYIFKKKKLRYHTTSASYMLMWWILSNTVWHLRLQDIFKMKVLGLVFSYTCFNVQKVLTFTGKKSTKYRKRELNVKYLGWREICLMLASHVQFFFVYIHCVYPLQKRFLLKCLRFIKIPIVHSGKGPYGIYGMSYIFVPCYSSLNSKLN